MTENPNNARIDTRLVGVVVLMTAASFAAVPAYNWFCKVTGFGGVPQTAAEASDVVADRDITIKFDANTNGDMPWEFRPVAKSVTLKIGENGLAFYEAHNPTDEPVAGQASFNVYPYSAGYYFTKVECFCFTEQVLQPGETVQMPVSFYVDPEILEDAEAKDIKSITLSYTFYRIELPQEHAEAFPAKPNPVN